MRNVSTKTCMTLTGDPRGRPISSTIWERDARQRQSTSACKQEGRAITNTPSSGMYTATWTEVCSDSVLEAASTVWHRPQGSRVLGGLTSRTSSPPCAITSGVPGSLGPASIVYGETSWCVHPRGTALQDDPEWSHDSLFRQKHMCVVGTSVVFIIDCRLCATRQREKRRLKSFRCASALAGAPSSPSLPSHVLSAFFFSRSAMRAGSDVLVALNRPLPSPAHAKKDPPSQTLR